MRQMAFINEDYQLVELPIIYSSKTQNYKQTPHKYSKPILVNLAGIKLCNFRHTISCYLGSLWLVRMENRLLWK